MKDYLLYVQEMMDQAITKLFLEEFQTDMPMDFCDSFSGSFSVFTGLASSHFATM